MSEADPKAKKDFFISYNKADRAAAEWIAWQLEEKNEYSVVFQGWDMGAGCNFVLEMDRGIRECERVLSVLSPDYLASHFTQPEWAAYFKQDPTGEKGLLVPVRVSHCEITGLLAQIVHTDLFGLDESAARTALLDAAKKGRRKPDTAPAFFGSPPRAVASKPRFFGALPDIWNVPHLRNPNFTEPGGRLGEMRDALRSGKPAALTQALAGLGGVGKTQLAVEYAYRNAGEYAIVWWVRAEQPATLAADFAALAQRLDLPEKDARDQPAIVAAVHDALRHRNDWLLIFDNVEKPVDVRDYLPGAGGHVVITSRYAAWGSIAQRVEVKKWAPEVAIEFLTKRTGSSDATSAADLAREMDCLPLALEHAAAYIDATGGTLADYLEKFRTYQTELLKRGAPDGEGEKTVATTWELSFQRLETESPNGTELLNLCAFFAPDDIPRDVIAAAFDKVGFDALAFDNALADIRCYSLIETGAEATFSMHRLVQAVIRERLGEEGREWWAEVAVKVVNAAFPHESDDVKTWKECARLLAHAAATTDLAEQLSVGLEAAARLISQIGLYSWGRAEYATAKAAFERALRIGEKTIGPEHPDVATRVNNLGVLLQDLGDLPGAKAACERALAMFEKHLGGEHPNVAISVINLGDVLRALGDLPGAKAAFERALRIVEKAFDPDHPNVAAGLNGLGLVLLEMGDLPGAKAYFERALAIFQKFLGDDHPHTKIVRKSLESLPPDPPDLSPGTAP